MVVGIDSADEYKDYILGIFDVDIKQIVLLAPFEPHLFK